MPSRLDSEEAAGAIFGAEPALREMATFRVSKPIRGNENAGANARISYKRERHLFEVDGVRNIFVEMLLGNGKSGPLQRRIAHQATWRGCAAFADLLNCDGGRCKPGELRVEWA